MKINLKPSDINCGAEEFKIASHIIVAGIDSTNIPELTAGVRIAVSTLNIKTDVSIDNIGKIVRISQILIKALRIGKIENVTELESRLLLALGEYDSFEYRGIGQCVESILNPGKIVKRTGEITDGDLEMTLEGFYFNQRIEGIFRQNKIETLGQILAMEEGQLLQLRNFGKGSLSVLKERIKEHSGIEFPLSEKERLRIQKYLQQKIEGKTE